MELPADLREKAKEIALEIDTLFTVYDDSASLDHDAARETIARALLAERLSATERAAKIADGWPLRDDLDEGDIWSAREQRRTAIPRIWRKCSHGSRNAKLSCLSHSHDRHRSNCALCRCW